MPMASRPSWVRKPSSKRKSSGSSTPEIISFKNDHVYAADTSLTKRGLTFAQDDMCINFRDNKVESLRVGCEDDGSICSRSSTSTGDSEGTSHTGLIELKTSTLNNNERNTSYPTPQPPSAPQTPVRKMQHLPSFNGVVETSNLPPTPDSLLTTPVFSADAAKRRCNTSPSTPVLLEEYNGHDYSNLKDDRDEEDGHEDGASSEFESEWEDLDEEVIVDHGVDEDGGSDAPGQRDIIYESRNSSGEASATEEDTRPIVVEDDASEVDLTFTPKMRQKFVASPDLSPLLVPPFNNNFSPPSSPTFDSTSIAYVENLSSEQSSSNLNLSKKSSIPISITNIKASSSSSYLSYSPSSSSLSSVSQDNKEEISYHNSSLSSSLSSHLSSNLPSHLATMNPGYKAKISMPRNLALYADECIKAAYGSRLSPYALHEGEYPLLRDHLSTKHINNYLNIRNGILRLWLKNTSVRVTREEAAGCAKDARFFNLADFAFEWLERNGYINHGCLSLPESPLKVPATRRRRTIAIIGAGISGLATARQLQNLLSQYGEKLTGPNAPDIVIFEGRGRLGGRVYSHFLADGPSDLPDGRKAAIDLGGQIVMGYDGNPLTALIQKQLGIPYHEIDNTTALPIYDVDGKLIPEGRAQVMQDLHDDILDRLAVFKHKPTLPKTFEGNHDQINACRDSWSELGPTIAAVESQLEKEQLANPLLVDPALSATNVLPSSKTVRKRIGKRKAANPLDSFLGPKTKKQKRVHKKIDKAAFKKLNIQAERVCDENGFGSLGKSMNQMFPNYHNIIEPNSQDLRLYNWYQANLEYCNATPVDKPSLECWDQDDGNEFVGAHSMIIGGYSQVVKGLFSTPSRLDIRTKQEVTRIKYDAKRKEKGVTLKFKDGSEFTADKVIVTLPLGVLKAKSVQFDPPLPEPKQSAIDKLGFGLLNKVILVFEEAFWDTTKDGFGCLRQPDGDENVLSNYEAKRGRFYMWWNASKVAGRPTLVGLMVGDAAEQTENDKDEDLEREAIGILKKCFGPDKVPDQAKETIVTRWRHDSFARGTYSYIAAGSSGDDYDTIATPMNDQVFFAGEHTSRHYPATVHGAYISGLRAASEVTDSLFGAIQVPQPLIPPRVRRTQQVTTKVTVSASAATKPAQPKPTATVKVTKRRAEEDPESSRATKKQKEEAADELEEFVRAKMTKTIGQKPAEPTKETTNPFLIYQKSHFPIAKAKADADKRKATGNNQAKAEREEVRVVLGRMWRDASEETKRPYREQVGRNKAANASAEAQYKVDMEEWEKRSRAFLATFRQGCPGRNSREGEWKDSPLVEEEEERE